MDFTNLAQSHEEICQSNLTELLKLVSPVLWAQNLADESQELKTGFLKYFVDGDFIVWENIVPEFSGTKEQKLSHIFCTQAERSGSLISNKMQILPSYFFNFLEGIIHDADLEGDGKDSSTELSVFSMPKRLDADVYNLGFIQIHSRDKEINFSLPAVILPDDHYDFLIRNDKADLLENIGKLASLVNHDYLHHFTSDLLVKTIARNLERHSHFIKENWYNDFQGEGNGPKGYESWALLSHAKTFQMRIQQDTTFGKTFFSLIDRIFDDIESFSALVEEKQSYSKEQNYFSNLAIFLLMRVLPTDHPKILESAARQNDMLRDTDYSTFELAKNAWKGEAKNMPTLLKRFFSASHMNISTKIPPDDEQSFRLEYIRRIAPEISYVVTEQAHYTEKPPHQIPNFIDRIERKNAAMVKSLESDLIMDGYFQSPFNKPH